MEKFAATGLRLPDYFYIPEEMGQLWRYAVSGEIEGNGREFGLFFAERRGGILFQLRILVLRPAFPAGCL